MGLFSKVKSAVSSLNQPTDVGEIMREQSVKSFSEYAQQNNVIFDYSSESIGFLDEVVDGTRNERMTLSPEVIAMHKDAYEEVYLMASAVIVACIEHAIGKGEWINGSESFPTYKLAGNRGQISPWSWVERRIMVDDCPTLREQFDQLMSSFSGDK